MVIYESLLELGRDTKLRSITFLINFSGFLKHHHLFLSKMQFEQMFLKQ